MRLRRVEVSAQGASESGSMIDGIEIPRSLHYVFLVLAARIDSDVREAACSNYMYEASA
jgi:hypothetical protein